MSVKKYLEDKRDQLSSEVFKASNELRDEESKFIPDGNVIRKLEREIEQKKTILKFIENTLNQRKDISKLPAKIEEAADFLGEDIVIARYHIDGTWVASLTNVRVYDEGARDADIGLDVQSNQLRNIMDLLQKRFESFDWLLHNETEYKITTNGQ